VVRDRKRDPGSGDFRLAPGSPAIHSGDSTAVPADATDFDSDDNTAEPVPLGLDGRSRFFDDPQTVDTGIALPPLAVVDMSAYEFAPSPGRFGSLQHSPITGSGSTFIFCGATISAPYRMQGILLAGRGRLDRFCRFHLHRAAHAQRRPCRVSPPQILPRSHPLTGAARDQCTHLGFDLQCVAQTKGQWSPGPDSPGKGRGAL